MASSIKVIHLIDAPVYVFRGFFSLPETLTTKNGYPANALYGYGQFLCGLLERVQPSHVAVCFDESLTSSFRNRLYADYKANRELPDDNLTWQFAMAKRMSRALGLRVFASRRYEADDLIATLVSRFRKRGYRHVIVSRDKDLAQVLREGDALWDGLDGSHLGPADIVRKFGVLPEQIPDYLALVGDPVDNIPGVPAIGAKAARLLLAEFGSLHGLYMALQRVSTLPLRGAARLMTQLENYRDQAWLSFKLATLRDDVRLACRLDELMWRGVHARRLNRLFTELGFGQRLREKCLGLKHCA